MSSTGLPGPGCPLTVDPRPQSLAAHGAPELGSRRWQPASLLGGGGLPDALGGEGAVPEEPLPVWALLHTPGCKGSAFSQTPARGCHSKVWGMGPLGWEPLCSFVHVQRQPVHNSLRPSGLGAQKPC